MNDKPHENESIVVIFHRTFSSVLVWTVENVCKILRSEEENRLVTLKKDRFSVKFVSEMLSYPYFVLELFSNFDPQVLVSLSCAMKTKKSYIIGMILETQ